MRGVKVMGVAPDLLPVIRQVFLRMRDNSKSMAAKNPFKTTLIAPCGMNCAICSAFLREKNRCGGCYTPNRLCSINCTISGCEKVKDRYRHDCDDFPCRRLKQLDKRYRTTYGMSMIDNLEAIRKNGIRAFVKMERERWTCTTCGGTIDVHHGKCADCGKERERHGKA